MTDRDDLKEQILSGEGDNDYERYMRIPALLRLQRRPEDMAHRDEMLFQTVHQTTELWLNHACYEINEAHQRLAGPTARDEIPYALRLIQRGCLAVSFVTRQLDMLNLMAPVEFYAFRLELGHGSGLDSPGWRQVRRVSPYLWTDLTDLLDVAGIDLTTLYVKYVDHDLYRLAEALADWDEQIALWRSRHLQTTARLVGLGVLGTQGNSTKMLRKLAEFRFYPDLWEIRSELSASHGGYVDN